MATITLDEIRASLDRKYGPTVIDLGGGRTCSLRSPLRMPKDDRRRLRELQDRLNALQEDAGGADVEEELIEGLRDLIRTASTNDGDANALLDAAGDDLAFIREVIDLWQESTDPGEASPSPS